MNDAPLLSVVAVVPRSLRAYRHTLRHLRAQTIVDRIELVIACPNRGVLAGQEAVLEGFAALQIVETGPLHTLAQGYVACIGVARAPYLAFTEDHCFMPPDWAGKLVAKLKEGYAAVGPTMSLANPASALSRAGLSIEYGPWYANRDTGEREHLPGHNSAYRVDVLRAYGDALEERLHGESLLHWDLRARGERLYQRDDLTVQHICYSTWGAVARGYWHYARCFGAQRAQSWGWGRRILQALAWPLVPFVRLRRIHAEHQASTRGFAFAPLIPHFLAALSFSALGEAAGYLFGAGESPGKLLDYEIERERHVNAQDRAALMAEELSLPIG